MMSVHTSNQDGSHIRTCVVRGIILVCIIIEPKLMINKGDDKARCG